MTEHLETRYLLGLDIGQAKDPTALVVIERFLVEVKPPKKNESQAPEAALVLVNKPLPTDVPRVYKPHYHIRHIERFQVGMSYGSYEDRTRALCEREPIKGKSILVVDHTGVGRRVFEALQEKLKGIVTPIAVNITGGTKVHYELGTYNVPKRDLVGVVQVGLGEERLKIASEMELASLLTKELQNFRIKVTVNANDTYEAWREGDHDDLVLATALACWWGENHEARSPRVVKREKNPWRGIEKG